MKKKQIILIVILLFSLSLVYARDISLNDAVNLALEQNLQLKNSKLELQTSERAYKYSYNTFVPDVKAMLAVSKNNEDQQNAIKNKLLGLPVEDPPVSLVYGINGSWTFNPAMITAVQIARLNYENGQISYEQACAQTKQSVSKLYYAIVLQQNSLKISEATFQAQLERYQQAQRDYDNGLVPVLALLQSQVAYQNLKPTLEDAKTNLANSKRQLALILGLNPLEELNLTSTIESEVVSINKEDLSELIENRYDVQKLMNNESLLKLQKTALIERTFIPSVVLSASWQPALYDISKKGKDYWIDTGSISATVAWNLTNLLPFSSGYKDLKDVESGLEQLEYGKQLAFDNAKIEILNLVDKLNQARYNIESCETAEKLAQENYNMRFASYNVGMSDYLDLQEAQNQLNQSKLGKLSAQYNYISALIDLEYATNQTII